MELFGILICICGGLHFVTSQSVANVTAASGTDYVIVCSLNGTFTLPEWKGPPSLTRYTIQGSSNFNPALTNIARLKYASNNRDLIIINANSGDAGVYQCSYPGLGDHTAELLITLIVVFIFLVFLWFGQCIGGVTLCSVALIATVILIKVGRKGKIVKWNLSKLDGLVLLLSIVAFLYSLIVGAYTVSKKDDCRKCTSCDMNTCVHTLKLGIACIVMACIDFVVSIVLFIIRQGWCGERFSCLNQVLPVCKDTEQRGPPDGKPDNHTAKEKQREMKLQIHKEQTQQHHKETEVHKGKRNKEKHEEPSKGRPLPQPSENNRPMPDIPSDRHKRGLSANFHDDRDTQLDDNILHTLPVAKKPKNALDPMNTEGQSKNPDDQPKKKKKKKKDRDTSRSDEIEDN